MMGIESHNEKTSKIYFRGICILFFFIQALLGFVIHDFYQRFEVLENQSDEYETELTVLKTEFIDLEKSNSRLIHFIINSRKEK